MDKHWLNLIIDKEDRRSDKIRKCKLCGRDFRARTQKKYCDSCASGGLIGPPLGSKLKCVRCGAAIVKDHPRRRYCAKHRKKRYKPMNPLNKTCTCPHCGTQFIRTNGPQKYCTKACSKAVVKKQNRTKYLAVRHKNQPAKYRLCKRCKKYFHADEMGRLYCRPCAAEAQKESIRRRRERLHKISIGKCYTIR